MMRHLKASDFKTMPWKNGQGTTTQIDIFPKDANFPEDDFLWRVSAATIRTSSPFSKFPGYDRFLSVWQGNGLILKGKKLTEGQIIRLSGEETVFGELVDEDVLDFNVIFKKDSVDASMTFASTLAGQTLELFLDHQTHYVFCAKGGFIADHHEVGVGECLVVENMNCLSVVATNSRDLKIFLVQVSVR